MVITFKLNSIIHIPENTVNQIINVEFNNENFFEMLKIITDIKIPHTNHIIK